MKNVIITGSNGMIGKLVLQGCLANENVNVVTSITRRSIGFTHERLVEVIHKDFSDFSKVEQHLKEQDVCFYCLGVYTGQVSANEFKKITVEFTKAFAKSLKANSDVTFCFLSGQGADLSEESRILFAKQKGIAENILLHMQFEQTYIFRPGYIYPDTPRNEPNLFYKSMRVLYKPVSKIFPNIGVTSGQLAAKMIDVGLNGGDKVIYKNKDIRS